MRMQYLAHRNPENGEEQPLQEHLQNVGRLAAGFTAEFGDGESGRIAGMYHDIGKYSEEFQRYIRQESAKRVDHSTAGARELLSMGKRTGFLPAVCVAGHHAGLPNIGCPPISPEDKTFLSRMERSKALPDYRAYRSEGDWPEELAASPLLAEIKRDRKLFPVEFYARMLFSCLVDADFLDTERFMGDGAELRGNFDDMTVLQSRLEQYVEKHFLDTVSRRYDEPINRRRRKILRECMEAGDTAAGSLLGLTVPTGGGKTVASLAFALRHAVRAGKRRIIYVIPYTSIIEQNARIFRDILGEGNVIEHHGNVEYDPSDTERQTREGLAAENWDAPVVVTTNVQFFESLFANRSSKCRKLHNISNSIVIFDEAQMIPLEFLRPCMAAIQELVAHYRCTAVLCTATQPSLGKFFSGPLHEICKDIVGNYAFFRRAAIRVLPGDILPEELAGQLLRQEQVLCIVNTKAMATQIFREIQAAGNAFHLSTNLCPAHRAAVMRDIRASLAAGKPCRVVSTSLVEAGVDLDFPCVYREMAGLDSVIQAAGRCNREGKRPMESSIVYVFSLGNDRPQGAQRLSRDVMRMVCEKHSGDLGAPEAIKYYFDTIHRLDGSGLDKKGIMDLAEDKRMPFAEIAEKFVLIDEATKPVFVPYDETAAQLEQRLRHGTWTRALLREAGKYIVNVYAGKQGSPYEKMLDAHWTEAIAREDGREMLAVLLDMSQYDACTGLQQNVEDGQAILM